MADRTLRSAAVMAVGTVLSRLLGFVRIALLAAAIGTALRGDIFTAANTIPNSLYILLAGGVFNTVLVPQLVRAIKNHDDGGQDFTNRVLTFGFVILAIVTTACVVLAPAIAQLYMPDELQDPSRAAEKDALVMFVRLCLPQIFFYGAFVLVGQVLNARRRFGPMMWAPIANNIVACASIVVFLLIYRTGDNPATYTSGEELLLGLGHTAGIAVQLLVLLPYLKASGHTYRPKFGLRGTGLSQTAKLGIWTMLFVAVNQVTLVVVTQLALAGSASGDPGAKAGLFAYQTAMLIILVPHGIITVSLATAALPQMSALAADGDVAEVAQLSARSIRQTLAIVVPAAAAMIAFSYPIVTIIAGYGSGKNNLQLMSYTLITLALGVVPYTVQYFQLRTFYAFEDTRTPFFLQCAIAATNITAALIGVRVLLDDEHLRFSGVMLGAAFALSYLVAALISRPVLRRRVPRVPGAGIGLPLVAMLIAAGFGVGAGRLALWALGLAVGLDGPIGAVVQLGVAALVMLPVYAAVARVLRIHEVNDVVSMVTSKLPGRR
ncbi:murein biosynthesis integral membrane protein MurJ [Kribbella sandramycini]|uniref:Murein biosynthesis integral membrane protein MurJ n=1 Tax=Kribbella sandramycini TaxID=60450 RepID=A0A7Y4L013_9ACTN|nr:murein biosynthesis integral membrane protein MurJ [Kribbella sandramycini]MBB6565531.1 putative peptidoglycan lipid II flippase [Kribbella sandramycini]NOL41798.1 murein biosynthesis integral membrane protein MurJ [Kribbella sandramycini]